jgi:hypothetical protein
VAPPVAAVPARCAITGASTGRRSDRSARTGAARAVVLAVAGLLCAARTVPGQPFPSDSTHVDLPTAFDGPPPPVPPSVVSRDEEGRLTLRAERLTLPIDVDGRLDEAVYAGTRSISDFVQQEPAEGLPATEKTEVWIFFDRANVYVSARCWDTSPERRRGSERRRDNAAVLQNDHFSFMLDPFYDRRNGLFFTVNPVGGRMDGQFVNERQGQLDWNPIWRVAVARFDEGWTLEAAVPFKTLRYRPGGTQVWGFNARRNVRWRNETSYLARVPASRGMLGIIQASLAATLVGIEAPPGSKNLEIKPYAVAASMTDLEQTPRVSNHTTADAGLDVKYGITQNLTADFTYNTDFAQVEADEQLVNLTRFNLFLPEKREFFLENQGTFAFGGVSPSSSAGDTPILFYSRTIGLEGGRSVPIETGGRVTGRVGRYSLGMLNLQVDGEAIARVRPADFSVLRLKRDIFRRSSIGALLTRRSVSRDGSGSNETIGVDGVFTWFTNLFINSYYAQTRTSGRSGDDASYRAQVDYAGDRYGVQVDRLVVGRNFNPEVGFVRRSDMRRSFGQLRFSPRPQSIAAVRKFSGTASLLYIEDGSGRLETRDLDGEFAVEFQNGDRFALAGGVTHERLPTPFRIAPGVVIPVGAYDFSTVRIGFVFGQQRPVSGNVSAEHGSFYSGRKTVLEVSRGRVDVQSHVSLEPTLSLNWVDLAEGSFTSSLVGSRITYTASPLMFVGALVQYNSSNRSLAVNARLRWEYQPGSELFVVLNEQRDTSPRGAPDLRNRSLIVKITRMLRL